MYCPLANYFVLWWPPDVITGRGPQVNKFELVSDDGHQMSLAGGGAGGRSMSGGDVPCLKCGWARRGPMSGRWGGGGRAGLGWKLPVQ